MKANLFFQEHGNCDQRDEAGSVQRVYASSNEYNQHSESTYHAHADILGGGGWIPFITVLNRIDIIFHTLLNICPFTF